MIFGELKKNKTKQKELEYDFVPKMGSAQEKMTNKKVKIHQIKQTLAASSKLLKLLGK